MADKIFNGRIIHKNDIEENWKKAVNFVPKKGEIIVYNAKDETEAVGEANKPRVKIGDGITNVNDLPFAIDDVKYVTTVNGKTGASIVLDSSDIPYEQSNSNEIGSASIKELLDNIMNDSEEALNTANTAQSTANNALPKSNLDTRKTNQLPEWYFEHHGREIVYEFKEGAVIGLSSVDFVVLVTIVQWHDFSGGEIEQYVMTYKNIFRRCSNNHTNEWTPWDRVVLQSQFSVSGSTLNISI